ncbi:VanW family protein [Clostridium sp. UBA6640]|uniref:VanW family protein n=1 Tax=Clostridium sp. UBA6640 TaxID=1946370 RepID=UPI0025C0E653|nr:VanW family protein [Clostridium sp. UBA6640]
MKSKILSITLIIIFFLFCGILSFGFFTIRKYDKLIYPNVHVENIPVYDLEIEESKTVLHRDLEEKIYNKTLEILVEDKIYKTDYMELGVKFNVDKALNEAFAYGRNFNIFKKTFVITKPNYINIKAELTFNEQAIDGIIAKIESQTDVKAIDSKIKLINNEKFQISDEIKGKKLDRDLLKKEIIKNIDINIDIENIVIHATINEVKPKGTREELSKINASITRCNTNFNSSSSERSNNIRLATNAIDGTVIMPGGIFSFNNIVGERTYSKGYEKASVIVGDEFIDDLGGGICQVSTTLYNAVLNSDLEIVERRPHSLYITYVPLGQDATVNYGTIDLKFKNNLPYPIYIHGYTENNILSFDIYSNNEMKKKSYKIESEILEILEPMDKIKYDNNIQEGKRYVEKVGKNGYIVNVYKYIYENEKLIEKKLVSKDKYRAINNIVRVGM